MWGRVGGARAPRPRGEALRAGHSSRSDPGTRLLQSRTLHNEYSRLIFFRIDWIDLLAVKGTLKSLLQYHNFKASILQYSTYLMVQLSH